MNIRSQGHLLTLVQGHSDLTFSNFFSLETAKPIEAKFHVEPPSDGGMKVNTSALYHMTKIFWPPCPYMVKTLKNLLLWNQSLMTLKLGMQHWLLEY